MIKLEIVTRTLYYPASDTLNRTWTEISGIKTGFPIITRIDEEFGSATIITLNRTTRTAYKPNTMARLTVDSAVFYYIIDSDVVTTTSFKPKRYQHTITLVDETKILTKYVLNGFSVTNPLEIDNLHPAKTILDQVTKVRDMFPLKCRTISNTFGYFSEPRLFNFPNSGTSDYNAMQMEAPQISLNRPTVYQALCEILKPLNAVPTLNNGVLGLKYLNKKGSLLSLTNIANEGEQKTNDYAYRNIESQVDNAIWEDVVPNVCYYPSYNGYTTWRSTPNGSLFEFNESTIAELEHPIYRMRKVMMRALIGTVDGDYFWWNADITNYVKDKKIYDTLDVVSSTHIFASDDEGQTYKQNCVFYEHLSTSIDNIGETEKYMFLLSTTNLQNLLTSAIATYLKDHQSEASIPGTTAYNLSVARLNDIYLHIPNHLNEAQIHLEYEPMVESVISQERINIDGYVSKMTMNANYQANITNVERLGENMKATINRLANGDLSIKFHASGMSAVSIGDYTSDGYLATIIERAVMPDYVNYNVTLSKDYNRLSDFIGVDTAYRQYDISREGIKRHIKIDEYVLVGKDMPLLENNSIMLKEEAFWLKRTLKPDAVWVSEVPSADWKTYKITTARFRGGSAASSDTVDILANIHSFSTGNSVILEGGFNDTVVAGYKRDLVKEHLIVEDTEKQTAVKYTEDDGTLAFMRLNYAHNYTGTFSDILEGDDTYHLKGNAYPVHGKTGVEGFMINNTIVGGDNSVVEVKKDKSEILKFTSQIHYIGKADVIIQSYLAYYTTLANDFDMPTLSVYTQASEFTEAQKKVNVSNTTINYTVTMNSFWLKLELASTPTTNWCLADSDGNILFAVNDKVKSVYFNFVHIRPSEVVYSMQSYTLTKTALSQGVASVVVMKKVDDYYITLNNGDTIYEGEEIIVQATPDIGYQLNAYTDHYIVSGNITVSVTATKKVMPLVVNEGVATGLVVKVNNVVTQAQYIGGVWCYPVYLDDEIDITYTMPNGYRLTNVTTSGLETVGTHYVVDGSSSNISITLNIEHIQYTIKVSPSIANSLAQLHIYNQYGVELANNVAKVYYDAPLQITATTQNGYQLDSPSPYNIIAGDYVTADDEMVYSIGVSLKSVAMPISVGTGITKVTVVKNGTTHEYTSSSTLSVKLGDSVSATETVQAGYTSNGLLLQGISGGVVTSLPVSITASAELTPYTLHISKGTGVSSVTVKRNGVALSDGATIYYNQSLVVEATASTGYELNSYTSPVTVTGDTTVSITAHPMTATLTLTIGSHISKVNINGVNYTGSQTINDFVYGDMVSVTVTPATGYNANAVQYVGITDGTITSTTPSITVSASPKTYTLTISKGTGVATLTVKRGTTSLSNGATIYYDETLSVSATASPNYSLNSYSPSVTVSGNTTVSVTAYPTPVTLTLTKSSNVSYVEINGVRYYGGTTINDFVLGDTLYISGVANSGYNMQTIQTTGITNGTITSTNPTINASAYKIVTSSDIVINTARYWTQGSRYYEQVVISNNSGESVSINITGGECFNNISASIGAGSSYSATKNDTPIPIPADTLTVTGSGISSGATFSKSKSFTG